LSFWKYEIIFPSEKFHVQLIFQHCLEKIQDHRDKLTCPQCHAETQLGSGGVNGLLTDFGVSGLIETAVAGSMDFQVEAYLQHK